MRNQSPFLWVLQEMGMAGLVNTVEFMQNKASLLSCFHTQDKHTLFTVLNTCAPRGRAYGPKPLSWNIAVTSWAPQLGHFMRRALCDLGLVVACLAMLPASPSLPSPLGAPVRSHTHVPLDAIRLVPLCSLGSHLARLLPAGS